MSSEIPPPETPDTSAPGVVSREISDMDKLGDAREEVEDFLEGLLQAMDVQGEVQVEALPPAHVEAAITGPDAGLLIGRKGRTLDALQELTRAAVQRHVGFGVKVSLDVEGYREKRREAIVQMTQEVIEEARETGEAEMDSMSAYERKIVHDLVAAQEDLASFSEGEEPDRRVVIRRADEPQSTAGDA